jgi:hypothetical protein
MIFPLPDITVVNSANLEAEIAKADITGNMLEDLLASKLREGGRAVQ